MTINITNGHPTADDGSKPVTFNDAEALGAFDLASRWADRLSWPMKDGTASDELAELACMSALARWLGRWQPIHIHRAVLAGAKPEAVAAALGGSIAETFQLWRQWARSQRGSLVCGKPGVSAEDYGTVVRVFAGVGITAEEPHYD